MKVYECSRCGQVEDYYCDDCKDRAAHEIIVAAVKMDDAWRAQLPHRVERDDLLWKVQNLRVVDPEYIQEIATQ